MEYVEGVPIDRYCETRSLSDRATARAVRPRVCDALAHAHGQADRPSRHQAVEHPRHRRRAHRSLLDFGIAKLLAPDDAGGPADAITRRSERLLTPEYASPEQIRGEPVVVASDVYCLGVLAVRAAHRAASVPTRASEQRTSSSAPCSRRTRRDRRRSCAREPLRRRLKGDLDTIILTAMNKEPERRYASAAEMGADVRRHLAGQPVHGARHEPSVSAATLDAAASAVLASALVVVDRDDGDRDDGRHARARRAGSCLASRIGSRSIPSSRSTPSSRRTVAVWRTSRERARRCGCTSPTSVGIARRSLRRAFLVFIDGRDGRLMASTSRCYRTRASTTCPRTAVREDRVLVAPDSGAAFVAFPAWSPDGKQIAYVQEGAVFVAIGRGWRSATPNVGAENAALAALVAGRHSCSRS